jgi:tetratricopeptide (TPR) repeat protein
MQPLRAELLASARKFYEDFVKERADDPDLAAELAATFDRIGLLHYDLGNRVEGRKAYEQAIQRYETLLKSNPPDAADLQDKLAAAWQGLGDLEFQIKRNQAHESYQHCVAIRETLVKAHPENTHYRKRLARAYNGLGLTGSTQEAQFQAYRRAIEIRLDLLNTIPDDPRVLHGLSESFNNLGNLVDSRGHSEEAMAMHRSSNEYGRQAYERAPHLVELALDYAIGRQNQANSAGRLGRWDEKLSAYSLSIRHTIAFVRANPAVRDMQAQLLNSLNSLSFSKVPPRHVETYLRLFQEAQDLLAEMPQKSAQDYCDLAQAKALYAKVQAQWKATPTDAERAAVDQEYGGAVAALRQAVEAGLSDARLREVSRYHMFAPLVARSDFKALLAEAAKPRKPGNTPSDATGSQDAAVTLANRRRQAKDRAAALIGVGLLQMDFRQPEECQHTLDKARMELEALLREEPENADHKISIVRLQLAMGLAQWKAGQHKTPAATLAQVADFVAAARKSNPDDERIAQIGRDLADFYAGHLLWEEAAAIHHDNLPTRESATATWPRALEAQYRLIQSDRAGFNRMVAIMAKSTDSSTDRDFLMRVFTLVADPPSTPSLDQVEKWARERAKAEDNKDPRNYKDPWVRYFQLGWVSYRAGKYEETLAVCRGDPRLADWFRLLEAMTTFQLGRAAEARRLLDQAEHWFSEKLRLALEASPLELPSDLPWESMLRFELERKEAFRLLTGKAAPENPWWHLYRSRVYRALGQSLKAKAEWQAGVAALPMIPLY